MKPATAIVESASINPADHHVFLLDGPNGIVEEWASPTEKVGPAFGSPETIGFASGQMAFDTSGIPSTNGRIYVSRGSSLAVFTPPVPIPNIEDVQAIGRAQRRDDLGDDRPRPRSESVRMPRGIWRRAIRTPFQYTQFKPCEPPAPYENESTAISTALTGLQTEVSYRARVVVRTNNGVNRSAAVKIRPAAVLDVNTEPATNVTRTTAVLNGSLDPDGTADDLLVRIRDRHQLQAEHAGSFGRIRIRERRGGTDRNRQPAAGPALPLPPRRP